jgi:hypothetical protein
MAHVYDKKTKFNTKFKETNLFFLKEIKRRLELKNWTKNSKDDYIVCMASTDYPYCWDSVSLVEKRLSIDNWKCRMTNFFKSENGVNSYTWKFSKEK